MSAPEFTTPKFKLLVQESPVSSPEIHFVDANVSLSDIRAAVCASSQSNEILLNGLPVEDWDYKVRPEDTVSVTFVPEADGGLTLALILVAAGLLGGIVGALLFRPRLDGVDADSQLQRITGMRNEERQYKTLPLLLGKRKVAPTYLARPYTSVEGRTEYFHALLSTGYGPHKLENFRIGDVPLSEFDHQIEYIDHYENNDLGPVYRMWQSDIVQEDIGQQLIAEEGWTFRNTTENVDRVSSDFVFPQGIVRTNSRGRRRDYFATIRQDFKDANGDWWTVARVRGKDGQKGPGCVFQQGGNWFYLVDAGTHIGQLQVFQEVVGTMADTFVFIKNVPEHLPIGCITLLRRETKPEIFNVTYSLKSSQAVAIRTKRAYPSAQKAEDDRSPISMVWQTIRSIRPITLEQFADGVGAKRPKLRYDGGPTDGVITFRPTIIAIKIKATGQLNGVLDNFYVDATMCVPQDKDADWRNWPSLALEPSVSPADAYKWMLQGSANYNPAPIESIDHTNLASWRSRCASEGYTISAWIDYESTVLRELNNIAYLGRAEFGFTDGKFGVVEKIEKTLPVQLFTPKNSSGFESSRDYTEDTDGIKFSFENKDTDYEKDEAIFLQPSRNPAVGGDASLQKGKFTSVDLWGVDNYEQAYRLIRFDYYEAFFQREVYKFTTDVEGLRCSRGDLIRVQNDIINVGLGSGRVKAINGSLVTLDEIIDAELVAGAKGLQFRDTQGVFHTTPATYVGDGVWDCSDLSVDVQKGDLAVYGEVGKETIDCIVKQITYTEDMNVQIVAVNAANIIYERDDDFIPEYISGVLPLPGNLAPDAPTITALVIDSQTSVATLIMDYPLGLDHENYLVLIQSRTYPEAEDPAEFFEDAEDGWSYTINSSALQTSFDTPPLTKGNNYQFRAQLRGASNAFSTWSNVVGSAAPFGDDLDKIQNLVFQHNSDGTYLSWDSLVNPTLLNFEVRDNTDFGEDSGFLEDVGGNKYYAGLLTEESDYFIAAKSIYGDYGAYESITVTKPSISAIIGLNAASTGTGILISWNPVVSDYRIAGYEILVSPVDDLSPDSSTASFLTKVDSTSFTHPLNVEGTYTYFVRAIDVAGNVGLWYSTDAAYVNPWGDDIGDSIFDDVVEAIEEQLQDLVDTAVGNLPTFGDVQNLIDDSISQVNQVIAEDPRPTLVETVLQILDDEVQAEEIRQEGFERQFQVNQINARVDDAEAVIGQVEEVVADESSARATQINLVNARVDNAESSILQVNQAVADETSARTTQINQVSARVDTNEASIIQTNEAIVNEATTRAAAVQQLNVTIDGVELAVNQRIDSVESDVDGNTTAISQVQGQVNNATTGLNATFQLAQLAKTTADGNTDSLTIIQNQVNDPNDGLSATAQLAQGAKADAEGALSATATLSTEISGKVKAVANNNQHTVIVGTNTAAYSSNSGASWSQVDIPTGNYTDVIYENTTGRFYAVGEGCLARSTTNTGSAWEEIPLPSGIPTNFSSISYIGGLFVLVGASLCVTSSNLVSFTERSIPGGAYLKVRGNGSTTSNNGRLVAVGDSVASTTTNGTSWSVCTIPTGKYKSIAYSGNLGYWVAVKPSGIAVSTTGTSFANRVTSVNANWRSVLATTDRFWLVATDRVYFTSPNVVAGFPAWTVTTAPVHALNQPFVGLYKDICRNDSNNTLCIVGSNRNATTTNNGSIWDARALPASIARISSAALMLDTSEDNAGQANSRAFLGVTNIVGGRAVINGITIDGATNTLEFRADTLRLTDTDGNVQLYWNSSQNRWTFGGMLISDTGTGTRVETGDDGTYLIWTGQGAKTDANGTFWIKKNGTGFIKGEFFQGEIIESKMDSATGTAPVTATASNHNSAGKPVEITGSGNVNYVMNGNTASQPLVVRLRIFRGSTLLRTADFAAQGVYEPEVNRTLYFTFGQTVAIDTITSTGNRNYSCTLSHVTTPSGTQFSIENSVSVKTFENKLAS